MSTPRGTGEACIECGRALMPKEEGWRWMRCEICRRPICIDHTYYIRTRRQGLYESYYDTLRVCKDHHV